jgi:hypothetical protein
MMLDCVFHGHVVWVTDEFASNQKVRFSYLLEPGTAPGKGDEMYVAFWNKTKRRGYFLQIGVYGENNRKDLILTNEGSIIPSQPWGLELEDTLWGVTTYEHLMRRLHRLERLPMQEASVKQIPRTSAICEWPEIGDIRQDAKPSDHVTKSKNQSMADKDEVDLIYHVAPLHYVYPSSYQRIEDVDFRNLTVPILFGENGDDDDPVLSTKLTNGGSFTRHFPVGFDSARLDSVHFLSPREADRQYAMVWYTWTSGHVDSKSVEQVAYIFELKNHRLELNEALACDKQFDAGGPHMSFNPKWQALTLRKPHTLQTDSNGVVSAVDIVTLQWSGSSFVKREIRTELSPQGLRRGSDLSMVP